MRRASRSLIWIGGVLLVPFLLLGWSIRELEQAVGALQSLAPRDSAVAPMGKLPADATSDDAGRPARARLEAHLHAAVHRTTLGSGLLAITVTFLLVLYQRDVARRQQAERAVRKSEDRYRHLIDSSQGLICTHDMDGYLMSVNPAAASASGYLPEEMVGKKLSEFLVPAMRPLFDGYLQLIRQEQTVSGVLRGQTKDGREL